MNQKCPLMSNLRLKQTLNKQNKHSNYHILLRNSFIQRHLFIYLLPTNTQALLYGDLSNKIFEYLWYI